MSIEDVVRAWKSEEDEQDAALVANPVGEELSDEELLEATGGRTCGITCWITFSEDISSL